jgi:hypothetical protein
VENKKGIVYNGIYNNLDALGFWTSGNEWEVRSLALMSLGTYIGNGYLQVAPWWSWISHDTMLAASWASSKGELAHIPYGLPQ